MSRRSALAVDVKTSATVNSSQGRPLLQAKRHVRETDRHNMIRDVAGPALNDPRKATCLLFPVQFTSPFRYTGHTNPQDPLHFVIAQEIDNLP